MRYQARTLNRRIFLIGASCSILAACQPTVDYRGYQPRGDDLAKIQVGMSKADVAALLGSPSTTASIDVEGDSYYYISSKVEQKAFFDPVETDRQVFAVRFDRSDRVASFANYGLEDGKVIDFSTRKTPTKGKELTILQQLLGNIGRFKGPGRVSGKQGSAVPGQ